MSVDLRISGGLVVTGTGSVKADVLVNQGRIAGIVDADVSVDARQ